MNPDSHYFSVIASWVKFLMVYNLFQQSIEEATTSTDTYNVVMANMSIYFGEMINYKYERRKF